MTTDGMAKVAEECLGLLRGMPDESKAALIRRETYDELRAKLLLLAGQPRQTPAKECLVLTGGKIANPADLTFMFEDPATGDVKEVKPSPLRASAGIQRVVAVDVAKELSIGIFVHHCPGCLCEWSDADPRNPDCQTKHPYLCCGAQRDEHCHRPDCTGNSAYRAGQRSAERMNERFMKEFLGTYIWPGDVLDGGKVVTQDSDGYGPAIVTLGPTAMLPAEHIEAGWYATGEALRAIKKAGPFVTLAKREPSVADQCAAVKARLEAEKVSVGEKMIKRMAK